MKFYKGVVTSKQDFKKSGRFTCDILGEDALKNIPVTYVSPSYDIHNGGFFSLPAYMAEVLIYYDEDLRAYFYIGTMVSPPKLAPGTDSANEKDLVNSKKIYTPDGIPKGQSLTNSQGAGVKISEYSTDNSDPIISRTLVNSVQGHKLSLNDSPGEDCVILRNKDGDSITISANRNSSNLSDNCIDIKAKNSFRTVTQNGEIKFELIDGRDITIENMSTGQKGSSVEPAGNVNIASMWHDVNIYSTGISNPFTGAAGRVLISTVEGLVQIKSAGPITIYSFADDINVITQGGDLNLKSAGDINMEAVGDVNIRSGLPGAQASVKLSAGQATVGGIVGTNVGVMGTPLNLNSPIVPEPADLTNVVIPVVDDKGN